MSARNSDYSPLPQSNSDSDGSSEEELHVSQGNRVVNRTIKAQNSKGEKVYNKQKSDAVKYNPLDNDGDIGVALNKFHLSPDEVSILKPEGGLEIFSTSRKICFVFSLLLCVFVTVAFVWILPCNVGSCPNASITKNYNYTWEKNLINLETYGPINIVPDHEGNQNLVFLTKSFIDPEENYLESDLRCLKGNDGSLKWKIKFSQEPTDVDCELIDINADGFNDCLILGRNFLKAVNSLSGEEFWDVQNAINTEERIHFRNFPVIIPDLNQDRVTELLLFFSFHIHKEEKPQVGFQNYMIIISGKTGTNISEPLQIEFCSIIYNLMLENSTTLSFTCFNSAKKESFQNLNLEKIYKTIKNTPQEKINFHKREKISQHKKDSDTVHIKGIRLTLKNKGNCPEDCEVFVDIKDERKGSNNKTIYSILQKNTFGMSPVVLKTRKETGFILKFWSWHSKTEKLNSHNFNDFSLQKIITLKNNTENLRKRSKKSNLLMNNSKILDDEMLLESEWGFQRIKRTVTGRHENKVKKNFMNLGHINLHMIGETVVKIAFNDSHVFVSNVTNDEIIQICKKPQLCQPNVFQQRHSLLVARIDADGNEKLVTYASKYVHKKEETKNESKAWQIQSRIRVLNI